MLAISRYQHTATACSFFVSAEFFFLSCFLLRSFGVCANYVGGGSWIDSASNVAAALRDADCSQESQPDQDSFPSDVEH